MIIGLSLLVLMNSRAGSGSNDSIASWVLVTGRALDDQLLADIRAAGNLNDSLMETEDDGYRAVGRWIKRATGSSMNLDGIPVLDYQRITADELYQTRLEVIDQLMEEFHLSQSEMEWWMQKDAQIKSPYVFQYCVTPSEWLSAFQMVTTIMLILATVCLVGVFANEHSRKTDQLVFSSAYGKKLISH